VEKRAFEEKKRGRESFIENRKESSVQMKTERGRENQEKVAKRVGDLKKGEGVISPKTGRFESGGNESESSN